MTPNPQANQILFPPGRLVQGDLYDPQDKDTQGNPLIIKTGANAGKARVNYYFAVAIPKTRAAWWEETHTLPDNTQSMWGSRILAIANAAWPQGQTQQPKFAWKIEDGDSQTPNERGRKNADREGHPGCWIIKFGSMFPTKVFDSSANPMLQPGLVKLGFWVEVLGSIEGNSNSQKPGIYVNHNMVAFRAPDKEISTGPDPRAVGFGKTALPPGVTAAPVGVAAFPVTPPATPGAPGQPPAPAYPPTPPVALPPGSGGYTPPPASAPPTAVAPHPGFITPPGPGAQPPVPPAAPPAAYTPPAPPAAAYPDPLGAPAGYRMANPQGPRYEGYRSQGWTDAQLLQGGHMVKL